MNARKYIGKVLSDGHLSMPPDTGAAVGSVFEVILLPVGEPAIHSFAAGIAEERGFSGITEEEVEKIIHESRGVR